MDLLEFYEVTVSNDCEGKTIRPVAAFWKESEAKLFSLSKACSDQSQAMGPETGWVTKRSIKIYENLDEYINLDLEEVKQAALNKLTPLERNLLGLG